MDEIDISAVESARTHAEKVEAEAAAATEAARLAYYRAVADLIHEHGGTAAAKALGVARQRVYQLAAKAQDDA